MSKYLGFNTTQIKTLFHILAQNGGNEDLVQRIEALEQTVADLEQRVADLEA